MTQNSVTHPAPTVVQPSPPTSNAAWSVSEVEFHGIPGVVSPPYVSVNVPPTTPLVDTSCTSQGRPVTICSTYRGVEAREPISASFSLAQICHRA